MKRVFDKISVVGLGYIGLPTAAIFASRKIEVVGVDVDEETIATINAGHIHIIEPDLDIAVQVAVASGYLRATLKPEPAQAFLIAVPTPFADGYVPDLSYIKAAAKAIAPVLERDNLIVLESTSPVGATEQMSRWLAEERPDLTFPQTHGERSDIRIAHCPERVLPGKVMVELVNNDRIVGGLSPRCSEVATSLYKTFVRGECVITHARTAELAKLSENSFRDVNIAFANELSVVCDRLGVDVWELIDVANLHPRVNILQPGPGVGGHCIAVDPWFIVSAAPEETKLIQAARCVNDGKPEWVLGKIKNAVDICLATKGLKSPAEVSVAVYGLTFKPNIDDLRESPAVEIAGKLMKTHCGPILFVEPHIDQLPAELTRGRLVQEAEARAAADIHVMLVNHADFTDKVPANGQIVDTRGIWR